MPFLMSIAAETGICVPLRSKLTSASVAIPAFIDRVYRAVAYQGPYASQYSTLEVLAKCSEFSTRAGKN
jgi:hypothetical protein